MAACRSGVAVSGICFAIRSLALARAISRLLKGMLSSFADRQQFRGGRSMERGAQQLHPSRGGVGDPGLFIFVAMISTTFGAAAPVEGASRTYVEDELDVCPRALTHALTAALVGFVVGAYFLSLVYAELFYTLVALAAGLQKVASGEPC